MYYGKTYACDFETMQSVEQTAVSLLSCQYMLMHFGLHFLNVNLDSILYVLPCHVGYSKRDFTAGSCLRLIPQLKMVHVQRHSYEYYYPARMRSRGKVIGLYVCHFRRRCCQHENHQISRSTDLRICA